MFEGKRTLNSVKIILPPLQERPKSQQILKRTKKEFNIQRPSSARELTPLDHLKYRMKLKKLNDKLGNGDISSLGKPF